MSTSGDTMSTSGGYHEYTGGVQYIGGYHEYIRGCSVHQRDTIGITGGYHEYVWEIS